MTRTAFGIPEQIFINNEGVFGDKAFDKFKSLESRTNIEPDDFTYYGKDIPIAKGKDRDKFADAVGNHLKSVTSGLDNEINDIVEKLKSIEVMGNNKKKSAGIFSVFSKRDDDDSDSDDELGGGRRRRKRKSRRRRRKSMKKSRKSRKSRGRKRKSRLEHAVVANKY